MPALSSRTGALSRRPPASVRGDTRTVRTAKVSPCMKMYAKNCPDAILTGVCPLGFTPLLGRCLAFTHYQFDSGYLNVGGNAYILIHYFICFLSWKSMFDCWGICAFLVEPRTEEFFHALDPAINPDFPLPYWVGVSAQTNESIIRRGPPYPRCAQTFFIFLPLIASSLTNFKR